jgi:hypothetical protein
MCGSTVWICSDEAASGQADCVVIVTAHSGFDYKALVLQCR